MTIRVERGTPQPPRRLLTPIPLSKEWSRQARSPLLAAAAVFVLLLFIWLYAGRWYEERLLLEQRAEVVGELSARGSVLTSVLSRQLARLQGLHAYVQTEGLSAAFDQKYEVFAADLFAGSRGIRNLAVAPGGEIQYVYPLEGNESVLGYRPLEDPRPDVVADVQRTIDNQQITISGPIELIQGGFGLIARQAVYQEGLYWGLVNVVIDIPTLASEAGIEGESDRLVYALRDDRGRLFHGSLEVFDQDPIITQIIVPEGYWELASVPQDGWQALIRQPLLLVRLGGLVIIALLTGLVYMTTNRQASLAAAVEQRTKELSAANTQLEQRVEERTLELTMLLNTSRSIASTLELEALLEQALDKLLPVVDYSGGAISILADGVFNIRASKGQFPQAPMQYHSSFSADNVIGRQLVEEQKPVLIPDVLADTPRALVFRQATGLQGDKNQNECIRSWMGIPLVAKERVTGMLALHHHEPAIYTQQNADLAMAFANQVAVAIENARLYEKAQRLAVLQERQRLARELHDSVSQALYGIALGSRTAHKLLDQIRLDGASKAALNEPIEYILSLSEGGLAEMRALLFELRPESLESEGLVAALVKQATALRARHHIEVTTHLEKEPEVSLSTKEALYRVGQEALHNIVKHANATKTNITLYADDGQLVLEIWDNGKGFDPNGDFTGHLGLRSMRERLERVGGALSITSSSSAGTQIVAVAPLA